MAVYMVRGQSGYRHLIAGDFVDLAEVADIASHVHGGPVEVLARVETEEGRDRATEARRRGRPFRFTDNYQWWVDPYVAAEWPIYQAARTAVIAAAADDDPGEANEPALCSCGKGYVGHADHGLTETEKRALAGDR